jgi:hypothetical protein
VTSIGGTELPDIVKWKESFSALNIVRQGRIEYFLGFFSPNIQIACFPCWQRVKSCLFLFFNNPLLHSASPLCYAIDKLIKLQAKWWHDLVAVFPIKLRFLGVTVYFSSPNFWSFLKEIGEWPLSKIVLMNLIVVKC